MRKVKYLVEYRGIKYEVIPDSDLEDEITMSLKSCRGVDIQRQPCCNICTQLRKCCLTAEQKVLGTNCCWFRRRKGK